MARLLAILGFALLTVSSAHAAYYKPIELHPDYNHTKYSPACHEFEKQLRAYTTCFDTLEDDGEAWGIPDFVSYEMKAFPGVLPGGPSRPSWFTEVALKEQGIAPDDKTYKYSQDFRRTHPNWYERGHLTMKQHAWRLGPNADWNTHTLLNAVPQRASFNKGIWRNLEDKTAEWADEFGAVWIIAGPVFIHGKPHSFLGEADKEEMLVAIPDALFKVVIRVDEGELKVLAFVYPQEGESIAPIPNTSPREFNQADFLVSIDEIEELTGLDFSLPDILESQPADRIWD